LALPAAIAFAGGGLSKHPDKPANPLKPCPQKKKGLPDATRSAQPNNFLNFSTKKEKRAAWLRFHPAASRHAVTLKKP
jgi:hypothetical protein